MSWSSKEYDDLISGAFSKHGWFKMHVSLIFELGLENAAMLHYLINFHDRVKRSINYRWNDGWFFCTVSKIESELGMSQKIQTRVLGSLIDHSLIETKKIGMPAKRHVRLNAKRIVELVIDWGNSSNKNRTSEDQAGLTSGADASLTSGADASLTYNKKINNKKISLTGRGRKKPAPTNPGLISGEWDQEGGRILHGILTRHGSDLVAPAGKRRGAKAATLAQNFYRLRVERKVSKDRIKEMLRWLDKHYDDDWTPKIRKTGDLAANWKRYEEAMSRSRSGDEEAGGEAKPASPKAVGLVRKWLAENKGWNCGDVPWPEDVAEAMEALGIGGDELDPDEV